ncbi:MAG: helicase-related protein [Candidatus Hadarchaeales archaeon]
MEAGPLFPNPLVREEEFESREYQVAIADKAVRMNTLVVLPTALGKTVIAALVASHFLYNYSDRKVLVMAPTRPLTLQHRNTFLRLLRLRPEDVQVLTGRHPQHVRFRLWRGGARVFLATPQVVENDHEAGLRLDVFSLLIFDECHRARKNYSYTKVARAYVGESPYPVILGLTASPGADKEEIKEICDALFIERIEARTEEDPDVSPYVSRVAVEWRIIPLPPAYQQVREKIRESLNKRLERLSSMGIIKKPARYIFRADLVEASDKLRAMLLSSPPGRRGALFGVLSVLSSAMTLYHALELVESQGVHALGAFLERMKETRKRSHRTITSELIAKGVHEAVESGGLGEHPKVEAAVKIVSDQLRSNPLSRIILFTQYRDTSSYIVSRLSAMGIRAERFVGQADREGDTGLTQEEQAGILKRFSDGDISVLVATSIGEEGLDIPSVDLVVFYEPVPSEIRYIQRKGRTGRRRFGRVVILAAEGSVDVAYLHASRRMAEKMKSVIRGLNATLQPILRTGVPERRPMSEEELKSAGNEAPEISDEDLVEEVIGVEGELREAAERVMKVVLSSGNNGISVEDLKKALASEQLEGHVIREAVRRLREECQVEMRGDMVFPAQADLRGMESHEFEVERVVPGGAVLVVDGKFRANLSAEEYSGPRMLMRKGMRFRGLGELYRQDGRLCARIVSIERILS